jgi:hypothetical protein
MLSALIPLGLQASLEAEPSHHDFFTGSKHERELNFFPP